MPLYKVLLIGLYRWSGYNLGKSYYFAYLVLADHRCNPTLGIIYFWNNNKNNGRSSLQLARLFKTCAVYSYFDDYLMWIALHSRPTSLIYFPHGISSFCALGWSNRTLPKSLSVPTLGHSPKLSEWVNIGKILPFLTFLWNVSMQRSESLSTTNKLHFLPNSDEALTHSATVTNEWRFVNNHCRSWATTSQQETDEKPTKTDKKLTRGQQDHHMAVFLLNFKCFQNLGIMLQNQLGPLTVLFVWNAKDSDAVMAMTQDAKQEELIVSQGATNQLNLLACIRFHDHSLSFLVCTVDSIGSTSTATTAFQSMAQFETNEHSERA